MKIYAGKPPGFVVVIDEQREVGRPLRHRVLHSPTGFRWGYAGSGPADLARSILWDHLGEEPMPGCYQAFKVAFVADWGMQESWRLTEAEVADWLAGYRQFNRPGYLTVTEARGVTA